MQKMKWLENFKNNVSLLHKLRMIGWANATFKREKRFLPGKKY